MPGPITRKSSSPYTLSVALVAVPADMFALFVCADGKLEASLSLKLEYRLREGAMVQMDLLDV